MWENSFEEKSIIFNLHALNTFFHVNWWAWDFYFSTGKPSSPFCETLDSYRTSMPETCCRWTCQHWRVRERRQLCMLRVLSQGVHIRWCFMCVKQNPIALLSLLIFICTWLFLLHLIATTLTPSKYQMEITHFRGTKTWMYHVTATKYSTHLSILT